MADARSSDSRWRARMTSRSWGRDGGGGRGEDETIRAGVGQVVASVHKGFRRVRRCTCVGEGNMSTWLQAWEAVCV